MNEYRTTIELDAETRYYWVELGPIPGYPDWHVQSKPSRYPFPAPQAAGRFADSHRKMWPGRSIEVLTNTEESK